MLETGKLNLDDLALRIRELKNRQDDLGRIKIQLEAEAIVRGVQRVDTTLGKEYARDLGSLLEEVGVLPTVTLGGAGGIRILGWVGGIGGRGRMVGWWSRGDSNTCGVAGIGVGV